MCRVAEFRSVERALVPLLAELAATDYRIELSPVFKTCAKMLRGTLRLLDLVDAARLL